jgi:DNA sulfur modification protein DndD
LILTGLRVSNYRQYLGTHEVKFATGDEENVTVITGANGAGKTNLFLAMTWCLYGKGLDDKGALLSKGYQPTGAHSDAFVEVQFRHEGMRYRARRDILATSDGAGQAGELQLVSLGAGGRTDAIRNPGQMVNEVLSADARQYFFFDGERIDELSKAGHEEQVREAIRGVLKLNVLERAVRHLRDVEREFGADVKKSDSVNTETQELVKHVEELEEGLEGLRRRRSSLEKERETVRRQLDEIITELESLEAVRDHVARRQECKVQLDGLEQARESIYRDIESLVARGSVAVAAAAVDKAHAVLDQKRERGEIPSGIRSQLVEDLLAEGACICGRALDDDARRHLTRRRETSLPPAAEDAILLAAGQISGLHSSASDVPALLGQHMRRLASTQREMEDKQKEIDGLGERLAEVAGGSLTGDVGQVVAGLESKRQDLETRRGDLRFELGGCSREIEAFESALGAAADRLKKADAQSMAGNRAKRRFELASRTREAASELLVRFQEDMRERIEAAADRIFKQLVWKEGVFEQVRILEDYALDVIDRHERSALRELSAGERQILSLSFIVGMSEVTGEEAPLVIDTPFGRISEDPLHNIASTIPAIAGQLVLFVTDRELDAVARRELEPRIGKEYSLDFDDESGYTTVRVV